ncbi:hypothetical protein CLU79DRAFT_833668 [Phycomyces nitens]|nr:hypothetical protein CLU79DRAFT_833668 [Phycomyces nitens]
MPTTVQLWRNTVSATSNQDPSVECTNETQKAPQTLKSSLHTVVDNAKEYLADVCFRFSHGDIWAHRAILLARVPLEVRQKLMPTLDLNVNQSCLLIDLSKEISPLLFQSLLRFWYTSDFYSPSSFEYNSSTTSISSTPETSATTSTASSLSILNSLEDIPGTITNESEMLKERKTLEDRLAVGLLPVHDDKETDYDQLVKDLAKMSKTEIGSDVVLNLFPASVYALHSPGDRKGILRDTSESGLGSSLAAHRFMLATRSSYFYAMFCTDFRESSSSTIHLTDDIFSPWILHVLIHYFYTDTIVVPPLPSTAKLASPIQKRLSHKKHSLRVLQKAFDAADYLGNADCAGQAILHAMSAICHDFKCACADCSVLLPSMLLFAHKNKLSVPTMLPGLMALYTDPVRLLGPLWAAKPFSILVGSMAPTAVDLVEPASTIFTKALPADDQITFIKDMSDLTIGNITKHNSIHVLHSLHLCLSLIRGHDPLSHWSAPAHDLLQPVVRHTVGMISQNFDYYCVEYPILLSCVDGIGFGFSVDFLEFLLTRVLEDGIQDANAGIVYQGIIRDLVGRQEVVKNVAVDDVLISARQRCAAYIARRWTSIKAQRGFKKLDKETLQKMSADIGVPYRALSRPFDSDFSAIFSFKPKAAKAALKSKMSEVDSSSTLFKTLSHTPGSNRRLSLGNLRPQRSNGALNAKTSLDMSRMPTRPRSHSTESVRLDTINGHYVNQTSVDAMSSQPLIHLLSLETRRHQEQQDLSASPTHRRKSIPLVDELLPMDVVPVVVTPPSAAPVPRVTRLTFEIPTTPLRPKPPVTSYLSTPQGSRRRARSPRRHIWNIGSESEDEDLRVVPVIGAKVELLRRPLPTLGKIKYIGPVSFSKGTWVGVELESRLGNNDGSVDGTRYFQTDAQRGVFVKPDDYKILSMPV